MARITKTVKVLAGDNVVLPSSAIITNIYTSGTTTVTSTCSDITPTALTCLAAIFVSKPNVDAEQDPFENVTTLVQGVLYNGVYHAFSAPWPLTADIVALTNSLSEVPNLNGLITTVSGSVIITDTGRESIKRYFVFKGPAFLSGGLVFIATIDVPNTGSGIPSTQIAFPVRLYSDVAAEAHESFPACS